MDRSRKVVEFSGSRSARIVVRAGGPRLGGEGKRAMSAAVSRHIEELETGGGLRGTDIANLASVSKVTVSRWKNGTATPRPEDELRLSNMLYVVERLGEYYTLDILPVLKDGNSH